MLLLSQEFPDECRLDDGQEIEIEGEILQACESDSRGLGTRPRWLNPWTAFRARGRAASGAVVAHAGVFQSAREVEAEVVRGGGHGRKFGGHMK